MRLLSKMAFGPILVAVVSAMAAPATAATSVYEFYGGTGTGTLTLTDYTSGQQLSAANFVSFDYASSLVNWTLGTSGLLALTGSLADSGPATFTLVGLDDGAPSWLTTSVLGNWTIGTLAQNEGGSSHSFALVTAVPEPAEWALAGLGFALTGVALRRRRRVATVAA